MKVVSESFCPRDGGTGSGLLDGWWYIFSKEKRYRRPNIPEPQPNPIQENVVSGGSGKNGIPPIDEPGAGGDLLDQEGRIWSLKGLTLAGPDGVSLPAANFYEVVWFA